MGLIEGLIMGAVSTAIQTAQWNAMKNKAQPREDGQILLIDGKLCDWDMYLELAATRVSGMGRDKLLAEMDDCKKAAEELYDEEGKSGEQYQSKVVLYYAIKMCLKPTESYKMEREADDIICKDFAKFEEYYEKERARLIEEITNTKERNGYSLVLRWKELMAERMQVQEELNSLGLFSEKARKKALNDRCKEMDKRLQEEGPEAQKIEKIVSEEVDCLNEKIRFLDFARSRYELHREYKNYLEKMESLTSQLNQIEGYPYYARLLKEAQKLERQISKISALKIAKQREEKEKLNELSRKLEKAKKTIEKEATPIWEEITLLKKAIAETELALDKELKRVNPACSKAINRLLKEPPYSAWICEECNTINSTDSPICKECGKMYVDCDLYKKEECVLEACVDREECREEPQINFCRKCGKKVPIDSLFCPYCGEKITEN